MEFSGKVHSITDCTKGVRAGKWDWSQFGGIHTAAGAGKGSGGKGSGHKRVQEDSAALNHPAASIKNVMHHHTQPALLKKK